MTDEQLVELFQKGDKTAGETLLVKYKKDVLRVARRFFLVGGETEDLVQEGMCGLYSAMVSFTGQNADFSAYAYACIKNRILDVVRTSSNNKNLALNNFLPMPDDGLVSDARNPEDELIKSENSNEFLGVLKNNLSPFEYAVMTLYIDGVSTAEITRMLGAGYKQVDNAIMRAKRKLQKVLKGK